MKVVWSKRGLGVAVYEYTATEDDECELWDLYERIFSRSAWWIEIYTKRGYVVVAYV